MSVSRMEKTDELEKKVELMEVAMNTHKRDKETLLAQNKKLQITAGNWTSVIN